MEVEAAEEIEDAVEEALVEEAVESRPSRSRSHRRRPSSRRRVESRGASSRAPSPRPGPDDPFRGPGDWYVVHTYAGYENKVKANLESRIHTMQMEDKIFRVHIPMEDVMEIKSGKKQVVQKKVFPGYLLVKMLYDNDSWYVVRNTPGVTGFVSAGTGSKPTPLSKREVEKILAVKAGGGQAAGPPRLRRGRRRAHHQRAVRGLQRHDQRDQRRPGQAQGAGQHLRPGDAGRAVASIRSRRSRTADAGENTVTEIDPGSVERHEDDPRRQLRRRRSRFAAGMLWVTARGSAASHQGGTLTVVTSLGARTGIDPNAVYDASTYDVLTNTYDGLLTYARVGGTAGSALVPDLATTIPTPTNDGTTYTFSLRPRHPRTPTDRP